uniref:Late embryogenesis abundant protein LEA-2 subgroup domain-containing protein n=1 Tax=Aegilops tauschii subsp. strangulata TaxID=200361 RepID=A0A453DI33_AEGTS
MVENQNQTLQSVGLKAGAFAAAGTGRESGQLILARGPGTLNAHTLTRSLALSFTATVDSASLAQFALGTPASPALLQYNLTLAMTVRNPNKRVGLYYDGVEALALFDGQRFGFAPLDPFFQGHQASTEVKPAFGGQQVLEGDVTQANLRTQLAGGAVEVEVKLNAKLRVKVWAFKVPGPRARISCPLSLPAPGAAAGAPAFKPTDCKVWF